MAIGSLFIAENLRSFLVGRAEPNDNVSFLLAHAEYLYFEVEHQSLVLELNGLVGQNGRWLYVSVQFCIHLDAHVALVVIGRRVPALITSAISKCHIVLRPVVATVLKEGVSDGVLGLLIRLNLKVQFSIGL